MNKWHVCGNETIEPDDEKKDIESSICYECKTETKKFSWGMDLKKRVNKRQSSERQFSTRANSEQQVVSEKIIRPRRDVWKEDKNGEPNSFCNNKESERRLFIKRSVNEDNTVELVLNRSLSGKLMQIGFLESPEDEIETINEPFEDSTFRGQVINESNDLPLTIYFLYDSGKYIIRINGTNNQVEPTQNKSTHYYYPIIKFSEHFGSGDELRYSNIGNYVEFTQMDVTFGGKKKRKTNRNRRKTTRKKRKTKKKCKKRSKYKK